MVALGTCCNGKRKKSKHLHLSYFEDKLQVNAAVSAIQNKTIIHIRYCEKNSSNRNIETYVFNSILS